MRCTRVIEFRFTLPDRPGTLATFGARLRAADVNLLGLWGLSEGGAEATFRCVAEEPDQFRNFAESASIRVHESTVFFLDGADEPGALVRTLEELAGAGVNLDRLDALAVGRQFGCFLRAAPEHWETIDHHLARAVSRPAGR